MTSRFSYLRDFLRTPRFVEFVFLRHFVQLEALQNKENVWEGNEWEIENKGRSYSKFILADINKLLRWLYNNKPIKIMFKLSSVRLSFTWSYKFSSSHFYTHLNRSLWLVRSAAGPDRLKNFCFLFFLSFKIKTDQFFCLFTVWCHYKKPSNNYLLCICATLHQHNFYYLTEPCKTINMCNFFQ